MAETAQPNLCPRCEEDMGTKKRQRCPHCHALLSRFKSVPRAQPEATKSASDTKPQPHIVAFDKDFSHFAQKDKGLWSLVLVNLFTIVVAIYEAWELPFVMTVYAVQSLMIGIAMIKRMLNLNRFSTSGFKMNNKPVKEEPATRGKVALFFCIHYGMFHAFYLLFLGLQYDLSGLPWFTIGACCLAFAIQQWLSVRDDIQQDQDRRPNIGTLMFLPYGRVVPMHLMIIIGGSFAGSTLGILIFLLLKMAADILMYLVELYALYPKNEGFRKLSEVRKN